MGGRLDCRGSGQVDWCDFTHPPGFIEDRRVEKWSGRDRPQSNHKFGATFVGWMKAGRKSLAQ